MTESIKMEKVFLIRKCQITDSKRQSKTKNWQGNQTAWLNFYILSQKHKPINLIGIKCGSLFINNIICQHAAHCPLIIKLVEWVCKFVVVTEYDNSFLQSQQIPSLMWVSRRTQITSTLLFSDALVSWLSAQDGFAH